MLYRFNVTKIVIPLDSNSFPCCWRGWSLNNIKPLPNFDTKTWNEWSFKTEHTSGNYPTSDIETTKILSLFRSYFMTLSLGPYSGLRRWMNKKLLPVHSLKCYTRNHRRFVIFIRTVTHLTWFTPLPTLPKTVEKFYHKLFQTNYSTNL